MNHAKKKPKNLVQFAVTETVKVDESKHEDLVGQVTLTTLEEKARKKHKPNPNNKNKPRPKGPNPNQKKDKKK